MDLSDVVIVCDKGALEISKVINHIAYDLDGDKIPTHYFRQQPYLLDNDWERKDEFQKDTTVDYAVV